MGLQQVFVLRPLVLTPIFKRCFFCFNQNKLLVWHCMILLVDILIAHVGMFEVGGHGFLYPTFKRSTIEDNSVQQVQPTIVVNSV